MIGCDDQAISNFDKEYTTNPMQCLKILLPYIKQEYKKIITTYIKYEEFQYTLSLLHKNISLTPNHENYDISSMINALYPYCTEQEKESLHQLKDLEHQLQEMKNMEAQIEQFMELQQMMDIMNQQNQKGKD